MEDSLLALILPLAPEEMVTSWSAKLSALLMVPDSSRVPPLGRNTVALPLSTMPMAVERVFPLGAAIPATLPSAVRSRVTWSPTL